MLRDMEELLNSIVDYEVKQYYKEALNCYNVGAYKACVILSVIAGTTDLHKKVKSLSSSDKKFRDLDEDVENMKKNLQQYEKFLIEKCATPDIDMLNSNEKKELIRCLETRNDCAHPSNFNCSAEKARDVYSSIIDIICSRPALYGGVMINSVIEELNDSYFFHGDSTEKNSNIVGQKLNLFRKNIKLALIKKIANNIKEVNDVNIKNNYIKFLSYSQKYIDNFKFDNFRTLLTNKDKTDLIRILSLNTKIIDYMDTSDLDLISSYIVDNIIELSNEQIMDYLNIIIYERFINEGKTYLIIDKLINLIINNDYDWTVNIILNNKVLNLIFEILNYNNGNSKVIHIIRDKFEKLDDKAISYETIIDPYFINIIKYFDDKTFYELWIKNIVTNLNNEDNFYKTNNIISKSFLKIPEEKWINNVRCELQDELIIQIIDKFDVHSMYNSWEAEELVTNFLNRYPILIEEFLARLFYKEKLISDSPRYKKAVSNYIKESKDKDKYLDLVNNTEGEFYETIKNELNNDDSGKIDIEL